MFCLSSPESSKAGPDNKSLYWYLSMACLKLVLPTKKVLPNMERERALCYFQYNGLKNNPGAHLIPQ